MKTIFNIRPAFVDSVLLGVRVVIAVLMLVHGFPKLGMLLSGASISFPAVMGMSPALSLLLAVLAEVLCSLLILIGLGTRLAVLPLIITMLVAVFHIHLQDPFSAKELGLHYLLVYVMLLLCGSGKYSVDRLVWKKIKA
ncbi:MAG TPA: DoxX family protein [Cyclobacteriaceae bacterium]|nr:DoxX family protein [Cyclobacteriaceae bacterium]